MLRTLLVALIVIVPALEAQVSPQPTLRVLIDGEPADILREALSGPHILIDAPPEGVELARDTAFQGSVIVLRGPVFVSSTVHGDVIAVGADLFMRPGAEVSGRAVAIGGSTHHSTMARAAGGLWSFRFIRIEVRDAPDGWVVVPASPPRERIRVVTLPGPLYGIRVPLYDRVNGLSLPWGPELSLARGRVLVDPLVTYRSDIGAIDPSALMRAELHQRLFLHLAAGQATLTNDGWIQTDFGNSLTSLVRGRDYRNHYRAERYEARLIPSFRVGEVDVGLSAGARTERAWSVETGGPWSISGRESTEGMQRPNPEILPGRISSAVLAADARSDVGGVIARGGLELEIPFETPDDSRFVQGTLDAGVRFPTFGFQTFEVRARGIFTTGDGAPPQRFSYMGGSGTLPTFMILSMGGDRLLFVESSYNVPIEAITLGLAGNPVISLRHMIGSAGVGELPRLEQNLGLRLTAGFLRADAVLEPVDGRTRFDLSLTYIR